MSTNRANSPVQISGAGPSGLAAALAISKAGGRAVVHEHNADVGGRLLSEAAGFQDALWGFGMRYAMLSGILAGQSFVKGNLPEYDHQWQKRFGGLLRASITNRYLFEKLRNGGYATLLGDVKKYSDARDWLREHYAETWRKSLLFPVAKRAVRESRKKAGCPIEGCDCTWCRCQHGISPNPHREISGHSVLEAPD